MPLFSRAISLWRNFFHRQLREQELDEELRSLLELLTEQKMREGMDPEEARRAARIELGGVEQVKEQVRAVRTGAWLDTLLQDIRFALRMLRKNLSFSVIAALTLALGIGANTAMFSVVDAILLQRLPYKDATRLVVLNETTPKVGTVSVSYPDFLDWRADSHDFSQMAAIQEVAFTLAGAAQPENISGEAVTPNFLSMLGIRPFLGRDFNASAENGGTAPILLLSYELWQSHFGGDPNAVGKPITLDGRSFTTIGVLPPHFRSLEKTDVIVPIGVWLTSNPDASDRGERGDMAVVGRLSPDVTFTATRAEIEGIAARLAKEYPTTNDQFGVSIRPIRDVFVGDNGSAVLVLFGAVLFVLLIACANVANLFLARGAARTNEIAMRMALGASRGRMVRQMLTESFVLTFLGGALGLALAIGGIQGIVQVIPAATLSGATVKLNATVLLFVGGVVVLAAFIVGLAPALYVTKPDVPSELKGAGRTVSAGVMQKKLRSALAISEMSLALVLLVGASLMIKSLYLLMEVDPGFRTDRVLTMEMHLRAQQYSKDPAVLNFWQQVLDRVGALPGVESAAVGTVVPLTHNHSRGDITLEGMALPKPGNYPHPDIHIVSPGYLVTLGIPLLRGRTFTDADNEKAPLVGMINAMAARRFFSNGDGVGKRFMFGHSGKGDWITIVGVVGDTKLYGLANPARLEVYVPLRQDASSTMDLILKSKIDPAALTSAIRGVVASVDKDQPISAIVTMNQLRNDSVSTQRTTLLLLGLFSGLALTLAAVGVYGVMAYSVAQRTHEIGVRMALGAPPKDISRMVLKQGLRIAFVGVAIGLAASIGLTRLMSSLLFAVGADDPATFAGVAILMTLVALLACYIPARRAMRVDPMVALRYE